MPTQGIVRKSGVRGEEENESTKPTQLFRGTTLSIDLDDSKKQQVVFQGPWQMIRILVMANDSLLADSIASILAEEIDLDVARLSHRDLGKGDRYSVVIIVDEGENDIESAKVTDLIRDGITLLAIRLSLQSRNIFVYESYQLNNPGVERVIRLVREFGKTNLKKKVEKEVNQRPFQKTSNETLPRTYAV